MMLNAALHILATSAVKKMLVTSVAAGNVRLWRAEKCSPYGFRAVAETVLSLRVQSFI
jgi:hypothetical protein